MKWKTFRYGKVVYNFSRLTITNYPSKRKIIFFFDYSFGYPEIVYPCRVVNKQYHIPCTIYEVEWR